MNALQTVAPAQDTVDSIVVQRGRVVTGSSGAIASYTAKGFTVTKTANKTGRYTVQAVDSAAASVPFWSISDIRVGLQSPTADAAITTDAGVIPIIRAVSESTGIFYIQFVKPLTSTGTETYVDAEVEDTSVFTIRIESVRNKVTP